MPARAVTAPTLGSPNNYLSNITIDGQTINGFDHQTYNYNVNTIKNEIDLNTSVYDTKAFVSGIGKISIENGTTAYISVRAENGKVRTYTIHFTKNAEDIKNMSEIMNNSGFKYNENYLFGIQLGTNVSNLIGNISSYTNSASVNIMSSSGVAKTNDTFKTGDIINITVNGKPSNNGKFVVTEHVNHDKTVTIHFTYNGSEEVDKWEINGLIEGHHYEIIQKTDTDFIVKVDYSDANTIIANVVTKNGSTVKPNKDKYSPSTGSVTIGSTAAMLGVGLLILKRKLR